jgi:hypothetical protein
VYGCIDLTVCAIPPDVRSHMAVTTAKSTDSTAIRPFHLEVPEEQLAELRRRIVATQWPEKETVPDDSQGVPL